MQSASLRQFVLVGLVSTVGGCHSPYGYQNPYGTAPYQPYGPYTQPGGVYPAPGQPYVPGSQPGVISPTPLSPPAGNPPSTYDSNEPVKFPDNNAPPYKPNPDTGGDKTVPLPGDEPSGSGPAASAPGLEPTSAQQFDNESRTPFGEEAREQPAELNTTEEDDPFETPIRGTSNSESGSGTIRKVSLEVPAPRRLNPYGRDRIHANPEWLRGVVDFDSQQRTWQIIYSANPQPGDPNGGTLTLGSHPGLNRCRSGDVVLVEGAVNANQLDARGKPVYALDNITPLVAE